MRQLTDTDALTLPAAVRRMLKSQCGGEWNRITVDPSGAYTVWNSPEQAADRAARAATRAAPPKPPKPRKAPSRAPRAPVSRTTAPAASPPPPPPPPPPPSPPPPAAVQAVQTPVRTPPVTPPPPPSQRPAAHVSRRQKNPEAAALQELVGSKRPAPAAGVTIVSAPPATHEEPAVWSGSPSVDWSHVVDLEASAVKLRDQLVGGLPDCIPFKFLPDVLALYGMDLQIVEAAIRHPQKVEIRPETRQKKYPVLAFFRGDVIAILGMREPTTPMVIAAYAVSKLDPDGYTNFGSGGGGTRKRPGLPHTVRAMLRAIGAAGADVDLTNPAATAADVTYKGQCLGKVSVGHSSRQTVESDYQRVIRKINAIDQRRRATAI